MLVDLASILATGHKVGVIAYNDPQEGEKRLATVLMRGDPIIALDNCEAPLEGVLLNQALTQYQVELRILGQSKMVSAQTKALITATGNDLVIKGDMIRRGVTGRLDPKCEQPEIRQFDYDPIADAMENRGEIVAAMLTVLRAYHVAGQPRTTAPTAKLRRMERHGARARSFGSGKATRSRPWPAYARPIPCSSTFAPYSPRGVMSSATSRKVQAASLIPPMPQSPRRSRAPQTSMFDPSFIPRCTAPFSPLPVAALG